MRRDVYVAMRTVVLLAGVVILTTSCSSPENEQRPRSGDSSPTALVAKEPTKSGSVGSPTEPSDTSGERVFLRGELTDLKWQLEVDAPTAEKGFSDGFLSVKETAAKWFVTKKHDFAEMLVGVVPDGSSNDGRLRLGCATRGTDDRTVKKLGLVSRTVLPLEKTHLSFDLDWNEQANGCYLTVAVLLSPKLTSGDPEDESQWLKFEYVGVPPGKNARATVWMKDGSRLQCLYDEGWPKEQKTGRKIGKQHIEISLESGGWAIHENGKSLCASDERGKLPFDKGFLYLQMTSHSNYPRREIFFDNVDCRFTPNAKTREGSSSSEQAF